MPKAQTELVVRLLRAFGPGQHVGQRPADVVEEGRGLPVTMSGLNVTHQALAAGDVLDRNSALGTPLARICVELLTVFAGTHTRGATVVDLHQVTGRQRRPPSCT